MDMDNKNQPLTGDEAERFRQKVSLVMSMSGGTVETSLSVLLYAAVYVATANSIEFASVIRALADIYIAQPDIADDEDDEDDEGEE